MRFRPRYFAKTQVSSPFGVKGKEIGRLFYDAGAPAFFFGRVLLRVFDARVSTCFFRSWDIGCQTDYVDLKSGWEVAPDDDTTKEVDNIRPDSPHHVLVLCLARPLEIGVVPVDFRCCDAFLALLMSSPSLLSEAVSLTVGN